MIIGRGIPCVLEFVLPLFRVWPFGESLKIAYEKRNVRSVKDFGGRDRLNDMLK